MPIMSSDQPTGSIDEHTQDDTGDSELFEEAAEELRTDVDEALTAAREALPDTEDIWEVSAANTLGMLNTLRSEIDVEDAEVHLREAKKWYLLGERAGVFQSGDQRSEAINRAEEVIEHMEEADELLAELSSEVPQLRAALAEVEDEADE